MAKKTTTKRSTRTTVSLRSIKSSEKVAIMHSIAKDNRQAVRVFNVLYKTGMIKFSK